MHLWHNTSRCYILQNLIMNMLNQIFIYHILSQNNSDWSNGIDFKHIYFTTTVHTKLNIFLYKFSLRTNIILRFKSFIKQLPEIVNQFIHSFITLINLCYNKSQAKGKEKHYKKSSKTILLKIMYKPNIHIIIYTNEENSCVAQSTLQQKAKLHLCLWVPWAAETVADLLHWVTQVRSQQALQPCSKPECRCPVWLSGCGCQSDRIRSTCWRISRPMRNPKSYITVLWIC